VDGIFQERSVASVLSKPSALRASGPPFSTESSIDGKGGAHTGTKKQVARGDGCTCVCGCELPSGQRCTGRRDETKVAISHPVVWIKPRNLLATDEWRAHRASKPN